MNPDTVVPQPVKKQALRTVAAKVPTEREVHYEVKRAYEAVGCFVANLAQGYRPGGKRHATTRQTKGIPDLYIIPPLRFDHAVRYPDTPYGRRYGRLQPWWMEVKRPGGKQSLDQKAFQVMCDERGVGYVLGGVAEALDYMRKIGLIL